MISKKEFNVGFSLSYLLSYALRCEILAQTKSELVTMKEAGEQFNKKVILIILS